MPRRYHYNFWFQKSDSKLISSFGYSTFVKNRDEVYEILVKNNIESRPIICGNIARQPFMKEKYLTHLKDKWLEGLSFNSAHNWTPGNAIVFDCCRLHCASDFTKHQIKNKLGISIFTKYK